MPMRTQIKQDNLLKSNFGIEKIPFNDTLRFNVHLFSANYFQTFKITYNLKKYTNQIEALSV